MLYPTRWGKGLVTGETGLFEASISDKDFGICSYPGRVTVFRLLHKAEELHAAHLGAIAWLEAVAPPTLAI